MSSLEQATQVFVQEAQDILLGLEDEILRLEEDASTARVDAIFRGLHTVKGSGAMFGYTALASFTHHFETAFDLVRAGKMQVDKTLIDLSLEARDLMAAFLETGADGPVSEALLAAEETQDLILRIQALSHAEDGLTKTETNLDGDQPSRSASTERRKISIRFQPEDGALRNGMRPDLLMEELRELGPCKVRVDASGLPPLKDLDPTTAYLAWNIELETELGRDPIDDVFIFAGDARLDITELPLDPPEENAANDAPTLPEPDQTSPEKQTTVGPRTQQSSDNIRIASSRLDDMMDSLGELVITLSRLEAVAETLEDGSLDAVVEDVNRLVMGLRDATLSIRMLPIEQVFGKFRRVIRDLSAELGKEVRLITEGGETEVDKNVIDRIGEPIVHMIRNSLDHGLESPAERRAAGKAEQGTVRLSARQEGSEILILIEDNGRGLDLDRIRQKAIERGLLEPDAEVSETALQQMIFEPGFSTATEVSSVSGRGVGMDSVRATIDALGGEVDVASRPGCGTRITLRLPVTMAIIDGLRVCVGGSTFVIPLSAVEECVEMDPNEASRTSGRSVLWIREHLVPYLELSTLFGLDPIKGARRRVVVVRAGGARIGLVVDDILGQSQTVIKGLSSYHQDLPGVGGATILGDGSVALIIDVATLVRWVESRPDKRAKRAA